MGDEDPFASYLGFTWVPGWFKPIVRMCLGLTIHARDGLDEACEAGKPRYIMTYISFVG